MQVCNLKQFSESHVRRDSSEHTVMELKQISEISGYPFEIHYADTDLG